jgi:hypothetical protein
MGGRYDEEAWKKVELIGYCPLMSQGTTMIDCKKEGCTWWRQAQPGHPKGKSACAINDLISQVSALNARFHIAIGDLVTQLVILNGRLQTFIKDAEKK